ncbi:MAG: hypothetical protein ABIE74_04650 [Pseudomonadota bacterium]
MLLIIGTFHYTFNNLSMLGLVKISCHQKSPEVKREAMPQRPPSSNKGSGSRTKPMSKGEMELERLLKGKAADRGMKMPPAKTTDKPVKVDPSKTTK